MKALELAGMKFGHLTIIRRAEPIEYGPYYRNDRGHIRWLVRCDCGKEKVYPGSRIKTGQLSSCGCLNGNIKNDGEAAKWAHYQWYRIHAKRSNKTFLLTLEEFLRITTKECFYCGIPWTSDYMNRKRKDGSQKYRGEYKHNGIDRLDSAIGYVPENCVPCCSSCNFAKNNKSVEQFYKWINRVYNHSIIKKGVAIPILTEA